MTNKSNKNKKHLFFYTGTLAGGGAERVLIELLKGLDRKKYQLSLGLLQLQGEYYSDIPKDVNIIDLSEFHGRTFFFKRLFGLSKKINKYNVDIVISFLAGANISLMESFLLTGGRFKILLTVQNNPIRKLQNKRFFERVHKFFGIKFLYKKADKIVSASKGLKKQLINKFNVTSENINVIHNPVNIQQVQTESKKKINLPWKEDMNSFKTIISIGRFVPQKGYDDLIKVFRNIRDTHSAKIIILGQGPLKSEIERKVNKLNLQDDVFMPGFVDNPWAYIDNSDLYLSTSHWEGFHMTIIEAMACGVIPVATDCDYGPGEIIEDGKNGFLVPVGDTDLIAKKVVELFENKVILQEMNGEVVKRAKDFNTPKVVIKYENLIDKLLK